MKIMTTLKTSKPVLISVIVLLILLVGSSAGITADYYLNSDRIFHGVNIGDWDLGGSKIDHAREFLNTKQEEINQYPIRLIYGDKTFDMGNVQNMGLQLDIEGLIENAYSTGRKGSILDKAHIRLNIARQGENIPLRFDINQESLTEKLKGIDKEISITPKNAELIIQPDNQVLITRSIAGKQINFEKTVSIIEEKLSYPTKAGYEIPIIVDEIHPKVTTEALEQKGIKQFLSSYTTKFNPSNVGRSKNIITAASSINGLMIEPQGEFSFNEIVGPRSSEQGYKEAPIIVNGQLVPGIGGGVCQVSTTLYNAALLSDLEITQRFNHSLPSTYVDLGRDAAVTYGGLDFKFKNNTEHYIYLTSSVDNDKLTIKIFGTNSGKNTIRIISEVIEVIEPKIVRKEDPSLPIGEEVIEQGSKGYKVKTWRITRSDSGEERRDYLGQDYYRPTETIVWYGTKVVPTNKKQPDFSIIEEEVIADDIIVEDGNDTDESV